jgi:hypothetical protein
MEKLLPPTGHMHNLQQGRSNFHTRAHLIGIIRRVKRKLAGPKSYKENKPCLIAIEVPSDSLHKI